MATNGQILRSNSLQGPSIHCLPTELLRLIFTHACSNARHNFRASLEHGYCLLLQHLQRPYVCRCSSEAIASSLDWRTNALVHPLLFPYPILAVCRRWGDIVESMSNFWSRIFVFVDERPTALSRIQKQLRLSKDRELEIFVVRRPDAYPLVDAGEHERCRAVIDLVMPHLHRCLSINFDVLNTSSLPSISRDFRGPAHTLNKLVLRARVDDGKPPGDRSLVSTPPPNEKPLECPNLTVVDIDGRNFVDACLNMSSWRSSLSAISQKNSHSITLSTFSPTTVQDQQFTIDHFLRFMAELPGPYNLTLNNVEFIDRDVPPFNTFPELSISWLALINLKAEFMTALLHGANFGCIRYVDVIRCGLTGAEVPLACSLTLQDIDKEEDIAEFLDGWAGSNLHVIRCPSFNDAVLETIEPGGGRVLYFDIQDCEGFSVRGLTEMVKKMKEHSPTESGVATQSGSVGSLRVSGSGPRPPSEEETLWFEENVGHLRWETQERPQSGDGIASN